jgi:hypothetical protein
MGCNNPRYAYYVYVLMVHKKISWWLPHLFKDLIGFIYIMCLGATKEFNDMSYDAPSTYDD